MNDLHASIVATALTLTAQAKPTTQLTVAKLAGFLGVGDGDALAALRNAPEPVQQAFGLAARPQPQGHDVAGLAAALRAGRIKPHDRLAGYRRRQ